MENKADTGRKKHIQKGNKTMNDFKIENSIYQNGQKAGYIKMFMNKAGNYQIELYLFNVCVPVEIVKVNDYFNALHTMRILENKYSY